MGPSLIFAYFSPHVSTFLIVLRLPVPPSQPQLPRYHSANPGFIPCLQLGIIASVECLVCPPHPHTTDNQQWKYMSGLVLMVFRSRVNSSGRSASDTQRHGRISFYQTFISRPSRPLNANRWCLEAKFQSQISPLLLITTWPRDLSFVSGDRLERCCLSEIFMVL